VGKGLGNYRSITLLSSPMVRSRSSGGIAVLFRRQAGRQINLTGVGIEAHSLRRASNLRDDLVAFF